MRDILTNPFKDDPEIAEVMRIARKLYQLHEAGQNYAKPLATFSRLVGHEVCKFDVDAAFGSIRPEAFAQRELLNTESIPSDLSYEEMLELVDKVCNALGDEFQLYYWLKCLEINTRDRQISTLIYWPDEYFGAESGDTNELSPKEILEIALANGLKQSK